MSLTKDGIKDRFERDSPPSESEFQTEEYMEHSRKVDCIYPQFLHGIPWMAKEPGVQLQTEQSGETLNNIQSHLKHVLEMFLQCVLELHLCLLHLHLQYISTQFSFVHKYCISLLTLPLRCLQHNSCFLPP